MIYALRYARFSSNNQREESIDAQLRAIDEYAEKNGIQIVGTYKDEAQTGKNDDRDEFQQMIEAIMLGDVKVDMILVHKFNRFARSTFDSAIYKKKLKEIGVRVVSVTQLIDDTPEGALLERFLEAIDEYYSANLALEVKKGLRENALKGKNVGGIVPLGFMIGSDGFYKINEAEAMIVQKIFNDFADGISKSKICESLNLDGFRTKKNGLFRIRSIGDMLQNKKYIGLFEYKLSEKEVIKVDGVIPRIIDQDVWNKCQEHLQKRTKPRANKVNDYMLTGKAYCLSCGNTISGVGGGKKLKNGDRLWYYECTGKTSQKNGCQNKKINKKWIEQAVVCEILKAAFNEETLKQISALAFAQIEKTASQSTDSIDRLKRQLKQNIEQQSRLAQLYLQGKMKMEILDAENDKLLDEQTNLEARITHINSITEAAGITENDVYNFIKMYVDRIKKTPSVAAESLVKSLINAFLEKIEIDNETVKIQLRLDFFNLRFSGCDNERFAGAIRSLSQLNKTVSTKRSVISNYDIRAILTEY